MAKIINVFHSISRYSAAINAELQILVLSAVFRSTTPSRPNKVGLKCPSVRPSTKRFFDFNEICYVGRLVEVDE